MPLAAIYDCEGPRLNDEERALFKDVDPWGFIVFARHCESPDQLRAHCDELREAVGRADAPILIDQEGGRVARMAPPTYARHPAPAVFGALWQLDPEKAREAARLNSYLLGRLVSDCGANVNCVPMLDVPQPDADPTVIGDRAYAKHPEIIAALGAEVIEGTYAGGALPILKHIPGHGRALCDSHHALPTVSASKIDLTEIDFAPFRALNKTPMAMTAHVLYEAFDAAQCATLSPTIIEDVIRQDIGFDGLLMSDDLKMKALGGSIENRTRDSFAAGCDIALCCNFSMDEKKQSLLGAQELSGKGKDRAKAALAPQRVVERRDTTEDYERLGALIKPVLAQA